MPNPTLIGGTQNNAAISSGTSATVTSTGSVTAGNFMIVFMLVGGASQPTAFTAPDGTWTASLATTATASGGLIAAGIFTKRATATGSFSGAFGWTTTATSGHWAFTEWSGTTGLDGAISSTQNASATNTSPSVTPATGLVNDTLVCCCFAGVVGVDTLTVPAGMSAISSMATAGTSAIPFFNGASLNLASASATGTKTWTIPTSRTNLGVSFLLQQGPIWGFSGGADFGDTVNPPFQTAKTKHFAAIAPKDDGIEGKYNFWRNDGWAREDKWQPPHPRPEKFAAIAPKYDGTEGAYQFWRNDGWEVQPWQPPHPRPEKFAAIAPKEDGTEFKFAFTPPILGWGQQESGWQPPHFNTEKRAPGLKGKSDFGFFTSWVNNGWEIQPPQPPHPRPERAGFRFQTGFATYTQWQNMGWEVQPVQPNHPRVEKFAATKHRLTLASYTPWQNAGWEVQPPQPPHPRPEKFAAIAPKEDGTEGQFNFWHNAGWEVQPPQPNHPRPERFASIAPKEDGTEGRFNFWRNDGWEPILYQPNHPRPERFASIAPKDDGTEGKFNFWINDGWEPVLYQPNHPRPEKFASIAPKEDGTEFVFSTSIPLTPWFHDVIDRPHARPRTLGAIKFQSGFATYTQWQNMGWEVQPVQPNHPRVEKFAATKHRLTLASYTPWQNAGWEPTLYQPNHPRPEKFASIAPKDDGIEFPFIPPVTTPPTWGYVFSDYPRYPRYTYSALKGRSDFGFFTPWQNAGWEVQPVQPNHPRPEKFASIYMNEDGIEFPFIFTVTTPVFGFDTQPVISRVRYERAGAIQTFPFIEYPFVNWINEGWEAVLHQPRHPRPERTGAMLQGIDGVATFIVFYPSGWEVQPMQPGHPRPERFGAIVPKEDGIEFPFIFTPVTTTGFFMANPIMGPALIGRGGYIPNPKNP